MTIIDTDDNITETRWAKMAEKVRRDDKLILGITKLKLQALSLAALEIVMEDIEGHLDDGEFEHPDH